MRILYTHRTQGVGAEGVHIMGMVDAFKELGYTVEMDGPPGCDPFEKNRAPSIQESTGKPAAKKGRSPLKLLYQFIANHAPQWVFGCIELIYNIPLIFRLGLKLLRHRPDFVYERYALGNFGAALLCRALRIPLILEVNDSVVIERSRPISLGLSKRLIEKMVLYSATITITISERFKSQLLSAFRVSSERILVCPNAVNEKRFIRPSNSDIQAIRDNLGLKGKCVLGSAGQFVAWHGLTDFVLAMAPLAIERDIEFLFIGDGPVREEVLAAAQNAGIRDRVHFTGMLPHALVPSYLATLDIAVIPFSNIHGSPMKLMEFMAMSLPVVAPDLPPIHEVLENEITGIIFPRDDMKAMHDRLKDLIDDLNSAQHLGQRGRQHVLKHFTWTSHAHSVLNALEHHASPSSAR
jgi:glycosyltransferase involved in cell wall biosynthesis